MRVKPLYSSFITETRTRYSRPAQHNSPTVTPSNKRKPTENYVITDLDTGTSVGKSFGAKEKSMEPNQQLADELLAALQFDQLAELEMALQQESDNCSQQQQQQQQQQQPQQQIQVVEHAEEAVLPASPIAEEIVDLSNAHADVKPNLDELLWLTQTVGIQSQQSFNSVGSADLQALLGPCAPSGTSQPQPPVQQQPQRVNTFLRYTLPVLRFFFFFFFFLNKPLRKRIATLNTAS